MIDLLAARSKAPVIDYQGLSPLFALVGGSVVVLLAGLFRAPLVAAHARARAYAAASLCTAMGLTIANWEPGDSAPIIEGALADRHLRAVHVDALLHRRAGHGGAVAARPVTSRSRRRASTCRLLLGSIAGMVILAAAENLVTLFVGFELLSIPLYVLCAAEVSAAHRALEAGLKYLVVGSVGLGHPALRARADLRRHGVHGLLGHRGARSADTAARSGERPTRCCSRESRWPPPGWRSRRRWPRSTSGRPTSTRARPPRSRASWPWRPRWPPSP